jgi:uncharacterized protein (DUF1697 family)
MTRTYIAFLRAVNVGGVGSHAVFRARRLDAARLAAGICAAISR